MLKWNFLLLVMTLTFGAQAKPGWESYRVPNAKCANGDPYEIYIRHKNPQGKFSN